MCPIIREFYQYFFLQQLLIFCYSCEVMKQKILYTLTDEAPALATRSLLPIIRTFVDAVGVSVETRDISLAGRILAMFPELLKPEQQVRDDLAELGDLVLLPDANVIKLPNISASLPQLKAAITELQGQGYPLPEYEDAPDRYDRIKGSAVNPVLREGNSDRRSARAVKEFAQAFPHSMGTWAADSRSHVTSMGSGDYYGSETSCSVAEDTTARIQLVPRDGGEPQVLRESVPMQAGDIADTAVMSRRELRKFFREQMEDARKSGVLFSVHLKATMMKVSDPIIFGHALEVFFESLFLNHADSLAAAGVSSSNGLADLLARIQTLPEAEQHAIQHTLEQCLIDGPDLFMVDSDRGITNFHVPSDVIIDASMPAAIRNGGRTWGPDGKERDTKFIIPDRSYAGVYQAVIDDCRMNGAYDPATMGTVPNVGLMAQKAEEYGSHDKTFEIPSAGVVQVVTEDGTVILEQNVETGDIFRMCQVKDAAVQDWVRLAVERGRLTGAPVVFWLDSNRAHDRHVIARVETVLSTLDTQGLEIVVMAPAEATRFSVERIRQGLDTISVTGNVLRDYLTDLFPILELGTSAKMLSIVPLMKGGGLFETGAGGSAPKHVQQFLREGHLRWDSLGEFLALAVSLEHLARTFTNRGAALLAQTLDAATGLLLREGKSPSRKVMELDNRGSHFYLALYWAEAMASAAEEERLRERFTALASALRSKEGAILAELTAAQGSPVDIGGYYHPDEERTVAAMRPSATLNGILTAF